MKLIVDSGATKAAWVFLKKGVQVEKLTTEGISPYHMPSGILREIISKTITPYREQVKEIYFYGTGCAEEENKKLIAGAFESALQTNRNHVEVHSDILAAARALCGRKEGIACILGTGSNSCRFDGEKIVGNVRGFGFILGDYGSGAVLGKKLISDWLYRKMPEQLDKELKSACEIDITTILDEVYRGSSPSRYLASFVPFIHGHSSEKYIQDLVKNHFSEFLDIMVKPLLEDGKDLSVNFIGSVAFFFQEVIKSLATQKGISIGRFLRDPMEGLIKFHN